MYDECKDVLDADQDGVSGSQHEMGLCSPHFVLTLVNRLCSSI